MRTQKVFYKIYCEPKQGAQGLPHYHEDPPVHVTKEAAQALIDDLEKDGLGHYWRMTIREVD